MKFSEKIVFMRKKRGISQDRLATKMGVSRQTIYKWEADLNTPEFNKIEKLAEILDISYDLLLDDNIDLEKHFSAEDTIDNTEKATEAQEEQEIAENIVESENSIKKKTAIFLTIGIACLVAIFIIVIGLIINANLPNNTDTDYSSDTNTDTNIDTNTDTDTDITPMEVRVTFDVNGGKMANIMLSLNKGDKISMLPTPTREMHAFLGWFTEDDIEINEGDTVEKSITLIAKWAQNQAIVYFDPTGGEVDEDKRLVVYGEKIGKLPIPTKENCEFLYWHFNDIKVNENTIIDSGVVLYAKWEEITDKVTITLDYNGGNVETQVIKAQNGTLIYNLLPTATHNEGLKFIGWFDEKGIKVCEPTKIFKSTTLIAYYGELPTCPYTGGEHYYSGWNYDNIEATCTKNGYAHRYCLNCYYDVYQVTQNALGHDFPEWTYDLMYQTRQCYRCLIEENIEYINLSDKIEKTNLTGNVTQPDSWNGLYDGDWNDEMGIFASCGGEFTVDFEFSEPTMADVVFIKISGTDDRYILSVMYEGDTEYTVISEDGYVGSEIMKFEIGGVITKAKIHLPTSQKYILWEEIAFARIPESEMD